MALTALASCLAQDDWRSMADEVRAFKPGDGHARKAMPSCVWQVCADIGACESGRYVGVTEGLAASRRHRIAPQAIAAPPLVLRASFEDWGCVDLDASRV